MRRRGVDPDHGTDREVQAMRQCQAHMPDLRAYHPSIIAGELCVYRCLRPATHTMTYPIALSWHGVRRTTWRLCDQCGARMERDLHVTVLDPEDPKRRAD